MVYKINLKQFIKRFEIVFRLKLFIALFPIYKTQIHQTFTFNFFFKSTLMHSTPYMLLLAAGLRRNKAKRPDQINQMKLFHFWKCQAWAS